MKPVKKKVWNTIRSQTWFQTWDQDGSKVRHQVMHWVDSQVRGEIWIKVKNQVYHEIS